MNIRCCLSGVLLLVAAWSGPACAMNGATAPSQSQRLWQLAVQEEAALEQQGVILHDASLSTYLGTVVERLWQQADTDLSPPVAETVVDPRPEAFAYPNGYLFLTTGMLNQMENEDQLAMIVAHEMIHYIRQHTVALYNHYQKPVAEAGLQYADLPRTSRDNDILRKIDAAERQADREGFSLHAKAGYCGTEVLALMSNLAARVQGRARPGAVKALKKRLAYMQTMLNQARGIPACTSATDDAQDAYINHIAPALMANAQASLRKGEWDQADSSVSRLQASSPTDARVYYLKGEILRRRDGAEDRNRCIAYYEKALELDPGFPSAQRALGELYFTSGRLQKAKPYFEAFLSLAPQDDAASYIKGYLKRCQE